MSGDRKHNSKKRTPTQQRCKNENRCGKNKERKAQRYADKFGVNVIIKILDKLYTIKPKTKNKELL